MELTKVDNLPPLVRGGGKRQTEGMKQIIEALKTGDPYLLPGIETDNAYNALQQRIRSAAKSVGIKVTIRRKVDEQEVYFQGLGSADQAEESKTQESVTTVKNRRSSK
jgi:hypothetical protein